MIPPRLSRRIRITGVAFGATLLALLAALWSGRSVAGTTLPARPQSAIPFTDVHPFGANFFLEREPQAWKREKAAVMAQEAGIRWARQQVLWADVQADEAGPFRWAKYDELVDVYRRHGIDVIARLDWSPRWANPAFVPEVNNPPDSDHVDDYAAFAGEAARHFRGKVRVYQVWTEPNLRTEWGNQPADPSAYATLLAEAAEAIRAADPNAVVLSAPLAPTTEALELAGNLSDVDYLEALYDAGAAGSFDILGANAFGMDRPPDDPPRADTLNFRRIELQREVMERHDDADKAVWLSEYGWNAPPAEIPDERLLWRRVDEKVQAEWTVEGVSWTRDHLPWVGVFSIWYFQYHRVAPDRPEAYFRMVDLDFTPRRLFASVREAAARLTVAGPGEWGERSSPVIADDAWRWEYDQDARGANALVAAAPEATVLLRFIGDAVSVRARGPVSWRLDGDAINPSLATAGAAAEAGSGAGWHWWDIARTRGTGEHVLEAVADEADVAIDAFRVTGGRGSGNVGRIVAALSFLALALAVSLVADVRQAVRRRAE